MQCRIRIEADESAKEWRLSACVEATLFLERDSNLDGCASLCYGQAAALCYVMSDISFVEG